MVPSLSHVCAIVNENSMHGRYATPPAIDAEPLQPSADLFSGTNIGGGLGARSFCRSLRRATSNGTPAGMLVDLRVDMRVGMRVGVRVGRCTCRHL